MEKWVRGAVIGKGSFGTVSLAVGLRQSNPQTPLLMAVKSAPLSHSSSLQKERRVLAQLQSCPQILRCFGHDIAADNGRLLFNVFLEYASGGSVAHLGKLPEPRVRRYTAEILRGLSYMHQNGFVHCDVKLRNILLCSDEIKIADFGLAKKAGEKEEEGVYLRGTPLYMAPESVAKNEYESPSDIWSLGCAVAEMVTGKPAWKCAGDADVNALLFEIGFGDELPEIPWELSEEGRDFLGRCFVRDPSKRWTAEMLLQHPFIANEGDDAASEAVNSRPSPRSVFDLMAWDLSQSSLLSDSFVTCEGEESSQIGISSPADRVLRLATATGKCPDWSECEGDWITVRKGESFVSQASEIQGGGCSVSSIKDSLLVLEEMVLIDREGEENSDSELSASTSSSANEIKPSAENSHRNFYGSDSRTSFRRCEGEFAFGAESNDGCKKRTGNTIFENWDCNFTKTSKRGCGSLSFFSWENWDCNFNCYSSILNEYKHRNTR